MEITRTGYGYVEPNFLSAPRTGQVRADLPVSDAAWETIEGTPDKALMNGMFVKRHGDFELAKAEIAAGEVKDNCVDFSGDGVWWLVFNEEKLYDERHQMHKDFAMTRDQFYDNQVVPRILLPIIGDTFTTNCFAQGEELEVNDFVAPGEDGILAKADEGFLQVVRCYTMPDGQPGVKIAVVANQ